MAVLRESVERASNTLRASTIDACIGAYRSMGKGISVLDAIGVLSTIELTGFVRPITLLVYRIPDSQ
jgi:hypothetical protein